MKNSVMILFSATLLTSNAWSSATGHRATSATLASEVVNTNLSEADVEAAQRAWGEALLKIGRDFESGGIKKAKSTASQVIDQAYAYKQGPVLFKPTLTSGAQTFRTTRQGALAYFVGHDSQFPDDSGFALKGWKKYEIKNAAVRIYGSLALTMGNVMLQDASGKTTIVDKTWAFKKDEDGKVRIVLHHSSLPYSPTISQAQAR